MNLITTVVGSYPTRPTKIELMQAYYKGSDPFRRGMVDAMEDQLEAGVDIISDGQVKENIIADTSKKIGGFVVRGKVSEIVDKVYYKGPIALDDFRFAKEFIGKRAKVKYIMIGPCTLSSFSNNSYYKNEAEKVLDIAEAINRDVREAEKAGAEFIQIDEPVFGTGFSLELGEKATETVLREVRANRILHVCGNVAATYPTLLDFPVDAIDHEFVTCPSNFRIFEKCEFSKKLGYGCIDTVSETVETVNDVQRRISKVLEFMDPNDLFISPDCGFKNLSRESSFKKLCNMVAAANTFEF